MGVMKNDHLRLTYYFGQSYWEAGIHNEENNLHRGRIVDRL